MMYKAAVIGCSAGGLKALEVLIPMLPADLPAAIIVVQHVKSGSDSFLAEYLDERSSIRVKEAEPRELIEPSCVYIAPAGYHLLVEQDETFSLNVDPRVQYAIPSIDVLFDSAAVVYREGLIGVVLTGANYDGTDGLKTITELGGLAIVQDPKTAEIAVMPASAIKNVRVSHVVPVDEIAPLIESYTVRGVL